MKKNDEIIETLKIAIQEDPTMRLKQLFDSETVKVQPPRLSYKEYEIYQLYLEKKTTREIMGELGTQNQSHIVNALQLTL